MRRMTERERMASTSLLLLVPRRRLPLQLVVVVALVVCPRPAAATDLMSAEQRSWLVAASKNGDGAPFPPISSVQGSALFAAQEALFDTYYSYHQAWSQYANPHYKSKNNRSVVLKWDEMGDSACWSGHQLAALAHRWNSTMDANTLSRINTSLDAFENLTQVSGRPGFMARFMGLAADPAFQQYYCSDGNCSGDSFGGRAFRGAAGYEEWVFLDSLSRDAYFGAALGLVSVLQKVDDSATHARVTAILRLMVKDLHKNKWWIISPHIGCGGSKPCHVVPVNPVPSFIALWQKIALTVEPETYRTELGPKYKLMLDLAVRTDFILEGSSGKDHEQTGVSRYDSSYFGANLCIISITALALLQVRCCSGLYMCTGQLLYPNYHAWTLRLAYACYFYTVQQIQAYWLEKVTVEHVGSAHGYTGL
jgi:hypothetical protein